MISNHHIGHEVQVAAAECLRIHGTPFLSQKVFSLHNNFNFAIVVIWRKNNSNLNLVQEIRRGNSLGLSLQMASVRTGLWHSGKHTPPTDTKN